MSMKDLQDAFELVETNTEDAFFAGAKDDRLIRRAEEALKLRFPPTYRAFLGRYGCGGIAGFEVYGISSDSFENSTIPNGVWLTLDERRTAGLPNNLVLVAETGEGGFYAIDVAQQGSDGDSPIVEWDPSVPERNDNLPVIAEDFGTFLHREISAALAPQ